MNVALIQWTCAAVGAILGALATTAAFLQLVHRYGYDKTEATPPNAHLQDRITDAILRPLLDPKSMSPGGARASGLLWGTSLGSVSGGAFAWSFPETGALVASIFGIALLALLALAIYKEVYPRFLPLVNYLGKLGIATERVKHVPACPGLAAHIRDRAEGEEENENRPPASLNIGAAVEAYVSGSAQKPDGWYAGAIYNFAPELGEYTIRFEDNTTVQRKAGSLRACRNAVPAS